MRLLRTLRTLRRNDGFAVPAALLMLIAATGIVTVGVIASVRTQSGTSRDHDTKSALPQAEAGVSQALLRFNRIESGVNPCSPVSASGPDAGGWCGPVTGGFDGGGFNYYVRPTSGMLEVVSMGSFDGVNRRVYVNARSSSGQGLFANATMLSREGIHMDSNARALSDVASNGDITMSSNALICGGVQVGIGRRLIKNDNAKHYGDNDCTVTGTATENAVSLPAVNQGDAPTVNDNGRFFELDRVSGNRNQVCWDGFRSNGQTGSCGGRELDIGGNSSVTLGGNIYSFCKLTLASNTSLYTQSGSSAIIYFDSPENCGYPSGTTQFALASNSRITSNSGGPANIALLFVGSTTRQTRIDLRSNTTIEEACEQNLVIYAPRTDILLNSNSTYCGALAGKTIELDSESLVKLDLGAKNFILPNAAPHYELDRFVECGPPIVDPAQPSAGC